jgi:hypothetical protein
MPRHFANGQPDLDCGIGQTIWMLYNATMNTAGTLGKLKKVELREAWKHEANHFTKWLAQEENLRADPKSLDS